MKRIPLVVMNFVGTTKDLKVFLAKTKEWKGFWAGTGPTFRWNQKSSHGVALFLPGKNPRRVGA